MGTSVLLLLFSVFTTLSYYFLHFLRSTTTVSTTSPLMMGMIPDLPSKASAVAAGAGPGSAAPQLVICHSVTPSWLAIIFILFLTMVAMTFLMQLKRDLRYRRDIRRAANNRRDAASRGVNEVPAELV